MLGVRKKRGIHWEREWKRERKRTLRKRKSEDIKRKKWFKDRDNVIERNKKKKYILREREEKRKKGRVRKREREKERVRKKKKIWRNRLW